MRVPARNVNKELFFDSEITVRLPPKDDGPVADHDHS